MLSHTFNTQVGSLLLYLSHDLLLVHSFKISQRWAVWIFLVLPENVYSPTHMNEFMYLWILLEPFKAFNGYLILKIFLLYFWPAYVCPNCSVQSLSHVQFFATPWITSRQARLSITNSRSSLRLTSIESVMPSSHLILCHPLLLMPQSLPASESFPMSQLFAWGGQSTGVSALASFLPKKSQGWSPSEWAGWISLQSKGLSRVFSNTTVQKHQFFGAQPSSQSNSHIHTWPQEKP